MSTLRADVSLAPLRPEHAERMSQWMLDLVVSQGIGLRHEPSLERTRQWIAQALQDPTVKPFAILRAGEHVGNVVLDRIDTYLASARLSVYIGEASARGVGVGRTALHLAVQRGFEELNLHKIWLTVHAENLAAVTTYSKVGFVLEGVLRDEFLIGDRRLAALYMGLLRDDWLRKARTVEGEIPS